MILIIDMASPIRRVVLADQAGSLLHAEEMAVRADAGVAIPTALKASFDHTGVTKQDLSAIVANIGPGGLSATRAGVAFVNAFAFGLGLPMGAIAYLDLLGKEAHRLDLGPVLCAKKAANDTAFVALCAEGQVQAQQFGRLPEILPALLKAGPSPMAALGVLPPDAEPLLPVGCVVRTDVTSPSPEVIAEAAMAVEKSTTYLTPINELSPAFNAGEGV